MAPISNSISCKNVIVVSLKVPFLNKYHLCERTHISEIRFFKSLNTSKFGPKAIFFGMNDFCPDVFGGLKIGGLKNVVAPSSDFHLVRPL